MKLMNFYKNGNYKVMLFNNGTKLRIQENDNEDFIPEFPENIDLKISNYCSMNCPFCAEGSSISGKFGDIDGFINSPLFKSLRRGTELAIGGGAISQVPSNEISRLIEACRNKGIVANFTFNIKENNDDFLRFAGNRGIGISYDKNYKEKLIHMKKLYRYLVIHTILGLTTIDDYKWLADNDFSVLVLGYKDIRRGSQYKAEHDNDIEENRKEFIKHFNEIRNSIRKLSFDCLAVEQLNMKNLVSEYEWEKYYMGDDGEFTMFIDLTEFKYGKNSTTPIEERQDFSLNQTIDELFKNLKRN